VKVLFACTANACRSQMAEAWARALFPADWTVSSCGLIPHTVSRRARWVMEEAGVPMDGQESKTFAAVDLEAFDLIVTLSEEAGRFLPLPADAPQHVRLPITDPMEADGTPEEIRDAFRRCRERVRAIVADVVAGRIGSGSGDAGATPRG
jgi:arsenate reductase